MAALGIMYHLHKYNIPYLDRIGLRIGTSSPFVRKALSYPLSSVMCTSLTCIQHIVSLLILLNYDVKLVIC